MFFGGLRHTPTCYPFHLQVMKKPFGYCRCGAHGWCKVSNDYCFFGSCLGFNQMVMWMILEITNQLFSSGDFPYMAPKNLGKQYFIKSGMAKNQWAVLGKCRSNGSIPFSIGSHLFLAKRIYPDRSKSKRKIKQ